MKLNLMSNHLLEYLAICLNFKGAAILISRVLHMLNQI